jgi:subfamily B ATP-binding cassette protein HlyB/CyaB
MVVNQNFGGQAGQAVPMSPEVPAVIDTGLMGLVMIARFHQIAVNPEGLLHEFEPSVKKLGEAAFFGDQEILLAARSLELKAKKLHLELNDIDNEIMPALCKGIDGKYFILIKKITADEGPSAIAREAEAALAAESAEPLYFVQPLEKQAAQKLSAAALSKFWDGEAILLTPRRSPFFGKFREFNLRWFIPSLVKYRALFGKVLLASFLIQLFGLLTPLFFQVVMDKVLVHKAFTTLDVLAIGFVAASLFEVVLNALRNYTFSHTTTRVDVELGARLFHHLIRLPMAWFKARQAGQSVARIRELDTLRNFITSTALTLVIDLGFTVIYFVVMWFYSQTLFWVVLGSIPFYVILSAFITPILKSRLDRKFQYGAANQSFLVEAVTGVETIKSLALEPQMQKRWENMLARYVTATFRTQNLGQLAGQVASYIQKLTTVLIIWFGAHQVMEGELTVGQLVAFNMIAGRISGPILKLTQLWQDFQQAAISLKRLGDILNTPQEQGHGSGLSTLPSIRGQIKLDHVRFRYRPDGPLVIDDLSFEVFPGEIVGLVGTSGSGKSTLANLIQRKYHIESGRVLLDGVDLAMVDTAWLRQRIGVVLQENVLFDGTVRENIAVSNPGLSMERVVTAARLAGAHDFIVELPEGYDTQVGERGASLSGGQRQRLAIARVLIGNPRILIFDEATSALDYESERIIQENMGAICRNRTVFIIAHRLTAIRRANRIFVLDRGRLVESGKPEDLLKNPEGVFYKMVRAQSQLMAVPRSPGPGRGTTTQ